MTPIPEITEEIINQAKEVASRHRLVMVNTLCLLASTLLHESVQELLKKMDIDLEVLRSEMERRFNAAEKSVADIEGDSDAIVYDADSRRVMRFLLLEERVTGNQTDGAMLVFSALLHDRMNEAKQMLAQFRVDYTRMREVVKEKNVKNDYSFPGEDDLPYPGDDYSLPDGESSKTTQKQKKTKSDSETPITDNFGTDLTAIAAKGGLDPVVGREREIERMVQILCRRKKNNPIIIGEPGVGKSAIVEGLAERIASRRVPSLLLDKRIVALDMASIVAGTQYRGQFEERLRRLIKELKSHPEIVLFIDEIHTIIGAGSAPGSLDAANILKPALARGEVQCIGATTTSEFKKSIEKDGALDRRFQKLQLEPTTADETLIILHNIKGHYEKHHNVSYTEEALKACVDLTTRYISDRSLPDKAIDALDEAGARMHLAGTGTPSFIEEYEKKIADLTEAKRQAAFDQDYERAANLRDEIKTLSDKLEELTQQWREEQSNHPSEVNDSIVAEVVSMMSGVPVTRVAEGEGMRLKGMREALEGKVIAQEKAVEKLTRAITRSRIGLKGHDRPIGTFLFVGPTGVGKTHLVKCLAEWMFGSKDSLIRIDMSEYGEKYSVSRLVGAPPGYVGYEEGGQLTERVRRHPYSVILLDEIEKAHPDVFNTLLQVMDEGRLTDGNGTTVDFRNTIIILTSNSGTRQLREFGSGLGFQRATGEVAPDVAESIILKTLRKQFAPEFLNRLDDIIMFNPLNKENAVLIADLELAELYKRLENNGMQLTVSDEAKKLIVDKGFDAQYGARSLKRSIQQNLEDALCDFIMEHPETTAFTANVKDEKIVIE